MKIYSKTAETEHVLACAKAMVAAARTAPKGKGVDHLETLILTGEEKDTFINKILETAEGFLERDAKNCLKADAIVFLAGRGETSGIGGGACGNCSYGSCKECIAQDGFCTFMVGDLGIACGSAASVAADMRVDNRIMYTIGKEAVKAQIFEKPVKLCYAIPLSVSNKSIFFDR